MASDKHTMTVRYTTLRKLVLSILRNPLDHEWSLQGFGMLRTYLDPNTRLHVWSMRSGHRVEGVSDIHNHPWHFKSHMLVGRIRNVRYKEVPADHPAATESFDRVTIQCGENAHIVGEPESVRLWQYASEDVIAGRSYHMRAEDLHRSVPLTGSVSIIERNPLDDPEHALVYYPTGTQWVDAKPRRATVGEIVGITGEALKLWFGIGRTKRSEGR